MSSSLRQAQIQTDRSLGTLRRANGTRLVGAPADFLLSLHLHLFDHFADTSQDVLYRSGFEQGLQDLVGLGQELREQYGSASFDLWQMDTKFILETWWRSLEEAGWGHAVFDVAALPRGIVLVGLEESPIATALGSAEHPICHFFAGLFAGALSFIERAERHATELECLAAGGAQCRFFVGPGSAVDSSEGWRQQGVPIAEIIRRLR